MTAFGPRSNSHGVKVLPFCLLILFWCGNLPAQSNSGWITDDPAYLKPVAPDAKVLPLLTVGESVPRTSHPSQTFRLVGIPDGMGLSKSADGKIHLWLNHGIPKRSISQPIPGGGFQQGAFVSSWILLTNPPRVASGDFAATSVFQGTNGSPLTGTASRYRSGFLADHLIGFDQPIYLAGEADAGEDTFDGRGGLAFAFVNGIAYTLPELGRYRKENLVALPGTGLKTVVFGLEDGPPGLNSQLYLYVGEKKLSSMNPLEKNGLVGGRLYAFASTDITKTDETNFRKSDHALLGRWIPIDDAARWNDRELDERTRGNGAFHFDRIKDGTYDRNHPGVFYFVTTGGDILQNRRGRLYRLTVDPTDPLGKAPLLEILLEGDAGDPIVNPADVDANAKGWMVLLEDITSANRELLFRRPPSVWLYNLATGALMRVAEIHSSTVGGKEPNVFSELTGVPFGDIWKSTGIIDASDAFGPGTWLLGVQARDVDSVRSSALQKWNGDAYLVEGGQVILMTLPRSASH